MSERRFPAYDSPHKLHRNGNIPPQKNVLRFDTKVISPPGSSKRSVFDRLGQRNSQNGCKSENTKNEIERRSVFDRIGQKSPKKRKWRSKRDCGELTDLSPKSDPNEHDPKQDNRLGQKVFKIKRNFSIKTNYEIHSKSGSVKPLNEPTTKESSELVFAEDTQKSPEASEDDGDYDTLDLTVSGHEWSTDFTQETERELPHISSYTEVEFETEKQHWFDWMLANISAKLGQDVVTCPGIRKPKHPHCYFNNIMGSFKRKAADDSSSISLIPTKRMKLSSADTVYFSDRRRVTSRGY